MMAQRRFERLYGRCLSVLWGRKLSQAAWSRLVGAWWRWYSRQQ